MTVRIAIPVKVARLRVWVDRGKHWTAVDHLVLWALATRPRSSHELAAEMRIPARIVNEIILNLMRVGWVELAATKEGLAFHATNDGMEVAADPDALPTIVRQAARRLSFLIEPFTLRAFTLRDLPYYRPGQIADIAREHDVRRVAIDSAEQWSLSLFRLSAAAEEILSELAKGETLLNVHPAGSTVYDGYSLFTVANGNIKGLPDHAPGELITAIKKAAKSKTPGTTLKTRPTRLVQSAAIAPTLKLSAIDRNDIFLTGEDHKAALIGVLRSARYHVIIHSTFLRCAAFDDLYEPFKQAARRGARIDILWGAARDEESAARNLQEAIAINQRCQQDTQLRNRVKVHMHSTKSHAKLLIADAGTANGFVAIVGSCNWLSTGYKRVEMSVTFREPIVIAALAREFAELIFASIPSSDVAGHLNRIARELSGEIPVQEGRCNVHLVTGDAHGALVRIARDTARRRIILGGDRLGVGAEPRALIPLVAAAKRSSVRAVICYSRRSGPVSRSDEEALKREAQEANVSLVDIGGGQLHGKFLIWDDDNIVISSLNWPSSDTSAAFPQSDIGVHICSPGLAADIADRLESTWPVLRDSARAPVKKRKRRPRRARRRRAAKTVAP